MRFPADDLDRSHTLPAGRRQLGLPALADVPARTVSAQVGRRNLTVLGHRARLVPDLQAEMGMVTAEAF